MISATTNIVKISTSERIRAYVQLVKFRLSLLVAFSCAFGYVLATVGPIQWPLLLLVSTGGFLVSGSAIVINQIIEKDIDKLMKRTMNRPIPTGKVGIGEAIVLASLLGVSGLAILLLYTNPATAALSLLSLILYAFVYTPLKRKGPIAVFVGAIPGALPPMLGWLAATGTLSHEAWIIFGIQFIWQFPHFWAIAWLAFDDYKKAGIKLLPVGGERNFKAATQIMIYTLFLIPMGLLPAKFGITGIDSAIIATVCGVLFLASTFFLMANGSRSAARRIMFGSFLYLPIVQVAYLMDKL